MNTNKQQMILAAIVAATVGAGSLRAQPTPAPTTGDCPCLSTAPTYNPATDTIVSAPDSLGYYSMFNGTDFTGWWLSGMTGHGSCPGAIFRVSTTERAIFSTQRNTTGGILMTRRKYGNYEVVFDHWPDFGNDGGFFNRTPANGSCFQTVLDYLGGASLGGTWGEANPPFGGRDYRPFRYSGNENTISVDPSTVFGWTNVTNRDTPANKTLYGCPNGCGAADWTRLWNVSGWNEMKIQFYGGLTSATTPVRMKSYFRRDGVTNYWVPIIADTTVTTPLVANYIGLQVHGGGAFGAPLGTWYRNIKWRPMTDNGIPVAIPSVRPNGKVAFDIRLSSDRLVGELDAKHVITVQDLQGKTVEKFSGPAGKFNYSFSTLAAGWLSLKIQTKNGTEYRRVHRDIQTFN